MIIKKQQNQKKLLLQNSFFIYIYTHNTKVLYFKR